MYEFILSPMETGMENLMIEATASPSSSPFCWLRQFREASRMLGCLWTWTLSLFASFFRLLALLSLCLFAWHHPKAYFQWDFFLNLSIQWYDAPISLSSFLSLSLFVNSWSCCGGNDLYQGKLHLIQIIPYTYRDAFLLFSICYASPLCA